MTRTNKSLLLLACLLCWVGIRSHSAELAAQEPKIDDISQQATKLEAELGKYKDTSPEAADTMAKLADLYHVNGRVFGLIRVANRFVPAHPTDPRHQDVMLKLLDGQQATSRNEDFVATSRQFLDRYPKNKNCPQLEIRLAKSLEQMNDRIATADAHRRIWNRHKNNETGRQAGVRAAFLYSTGNGQNITKGAELADEIYDALPAGEFTQHCALRAFWEWRRISQWAKSNVVGNKILKRRTLKDPKELWRLNRYMAENYWNQSQHANAAESLRRCRRIRDDDYYVHHQLIERLYNSNAKPAELKPIVDQYFQKYPTRQDRFSRKALLAHTHLRNKEVPQAVQLFRSILPFDAAINSSASNFLRNNGSEPPKLADSERALLDAIKKNPRDAWHLRYVLAFELYRDRLKDNEKCRRILRDFISQSPSNDGHAWNVISWLLSNAPDENQFRSDVQLILKSRRENIHMSNFRGYLQNWAKQVRKKKDLRVRGQYVTAQLTKANADPVVALWVKLTGSYYSKNNVQNRAKLLTPSLYSKLNDKLVKTLLWNDAYYFRHYAASKDRAFSSTQFGRLAKRFPKERDYATYWLQSATDYSPPEVCKEAALHVMTFTPFRSTDTWWRLMRAAEKGKDEPFARTALAWIQKAQQREGKDPGYSASIGDILERLNLKKEALAYWTTYSTFDPHHTDSRECVSRLMTRMQTEDGKPKQDERIALLKKVIKTNCDFHGRYAVWMGYELIRKNDYVGFDKVMRESKKRQSQRPFRSWDMYTYDVHNIFWAARNSKEISEEDRNRVYAVCRDMEIDWPAATARLALLEASTVKSTTMQRLLAIQETTLLPSNGSHQWDQLMPFAQNMLSSKDYMGAATLLTGMLANIRSVAVARMKSGRDLVAQSYSRMGSVGLTIDENSEVAPLLQAALYLRLGDDRLAFDTYLANKKLFDSHRGQVPVDLLIFVCENHITAGGDENHDRVEDILRGWVVKYSELTQHDDRTKAKIQLLLAKNFAKAQRYDIARSEYTTVMNRYAETSEALEAEFGIGETFMAQKVYDQAELVFEKLANSRDSEVVVRAQFLRGVLAYRRGDRDDARDIFRNVLERVPDVKLANQALFSLAEVYGSEERYIDQLNLLRTVGRLGRRSKRFHSPGASISIVVQDSDLGISRGHNKIPVIVTTEPGGDREVVYLQSGGAGKGLFRFDLDTKLGQVVPGDKVLQVSGNDVIRCDYPEEFKQEFKRAPLSDVDIHIASDAQFDVASSKIVDQQEETFSERLAREAAEEQEDQRVSQIRPANQIKPGNLIYLRVKDADRDLSNEADKIVVKLTAESGDEVQVSLAETGVHTGVFEGQAKTGELPAGALASDTAIQHSPLMAIDQDTDTFWQSEPDGATPKSLTIDMKDLKSVARITLSTPNAKRHAPVRGEILGSDDGRFWYRLASNPPTPTAAPTADNFGQMKRRVYSGNYYNYTTWDQIANLGKNSQPMDEADTNDLKWVRPEEDDNAKRAFAVIWHGKIVQERDGAARFAIKGYQTGLAIDGRLELAVARGNRSIDVWLERGTHDLTIFAASVSGQQEVGVTFARADHNSPQIAMLPFRESDFDLKQPFAQPAAVRDPVQAEFGPTEWKIEFEPQEIRFVRAVIHEYLGEALAINNIEIAGLSDDEIYIPTAADILSLASNNVLEIAGGDIVTATYTDELTQRETASSRLLTTTLTATYYDSVVSPIAWDFVRQNNGNVIEIRKRLMRIDPGERIVVEIVDYDHDTSSEKDTVPFEVILNDDEPVSFIATETEPYSGIFTKEVDTSAKKEKGKFTVKPGDRVYLRYTDHQNTFPGHAVPRESVVYVNEPSDAQVRILETRIVSSTNQNPNAKPRINYVTPDADVELSRVAFEAPLTIEVIDPDAAKDSRSEIVVKMQTTDGATVDVRCVVSNQFSDNQVLAATRDYFALEQGRFIGQVILQLGSKNSPNLIPVTSEMPRNLVGGPVLEDESDSAFDRRLITRVLNLTGKDQIAGIYRDERRVAGKPANVQARGRLISNGTMLATDRDYQDAVTKLHVGEKLYLMISDADQDSSDDRDFVQVEITSEFGEKEVISLSETLPHSGVFTGSLVLKSSSKPTPGNIDPEKPAVECYFGDTLHLQYVDKAASTESGELELLAQIPVVVGTDGLVKAFSKTFNDEKLAVETKFHIAESYFELFKSHKELKRDEEQKRDLEAGRRILREVMEDYPDPKYVPRIAYLLGQFAQELEEWDEAAESYEMIVSRYPDHSLAPDAQYKLAQTLEESGDFDEALEAYVTLAATYPKSPLIANVMIRISDHFYKKKNYKVAAQVGEKFLEKFEGHRHAPRIAYLIGQCYYKDEAYSQAGVSFDRFAKQFPDDDLCAFAIFWSGESFRLEKNNQQAFRRYNRCRWDFPGSEAAKYSRGRLTLPEMLQQFEAEARNLENDQ